MISVTASTLRRSLRFLAAFAVMAGFGYEAVPARALSSYTPSMVLTVTPAPDTAPNNPCATTVSGGVYVNSGTCGLRGAVDAANHYLAGFTGTCAGAPAAVNQPAVRINLGPGTYGLSYGDLVLSGRCDSTQRQNGNINSFVQLVGAGSAQTIIDGSGNAASGHPASVITAIAPLQMSGLTITGGQGEDFNCNSSPCGGGINANDTEGLSLSNVVITHNTAMSGGSGVAGGLYANDWNSMSLTNVQFIQNAAGHQGGAIWNDGGLLSMTNVTITGNIACGVYLNNAAAPWAPGNLCLTTDSAVQGGAIYNNAGITMHGGSITGNVSGSLVTGYGGGGAIWNNWNVELTNVTVANNTAGNSAGAVMSRDDFTMTGGSIANNRAGAIAGGFGDGACDRRDPNSSGDCTGGAGESEFFGTAVTGNTAGGTFDCKTIPSTTCTSDIGAGNGGYTAGGCPSLVTGEYCFSSYGVAGGMYVRGAERVAGGRISSNTAVSIGGAGGCQGQGGGVWNNDDLFYMKSSQLANNVASCGAGEYIRNYSPNNFFASRVSGNVAALYGGAFYADSSTPPGAILLNSTLVIANKAGTETGGIYASHFGVFLLEGASSIAGNTGGTCPNTNYPCS